MQDMEMVSMEQSGEELSACVFASVCVFMRQRRKGAEGHIDYI